MILVTCTLQDSSCIYVTAGWHCSGRGKHHGRSFWDNGGECQPTHFTQEENGQNGQNVKYVSLQYCKMNGNSGRGGTPESHCGLSVTIITVTSAGSAEGSCVHSSSHIRYPALVAGPHVQISLKAELGTVGATPISHNGASTLQSVITIQIQQIAASAHRDFQSFEGSAEPMRYEHEQVETFQGIATDKMTRSLYKVCTGGVMMMRC